MNRIPLGAATVAVVAVACVAQVQQPTEPVLDKARKVAAAYTQSLPDYIVKRTTKRYVGAPPQGVWRQRDTVAGNLAFEHGREVYSKILVNGTAANNLPANGAWSTGESSIQTPTILAPGSAALFTYQRQESIRKHPSYRYAFAIDQPHSTWHLEADDLADPGSLASYSPAYDGTIWIDRETGQALRTEISTSALPPWFPMASIKSQTDFDYVKIGSQEYLLPTHSETVICERFVSLCQRNVTDFKDYDKFSADTNITFGDSEK